MNTLSPDLLFQMDPIRVVSGPGYFYLVPCIGLILVLWILSRGSIGRSPSTQLSISHDTPSIPTFDDLLFESKALFYIKSKLLQAYPSRNLFSHTSFQMRKYIQNPPLMAHIVDLESAEYSGIPLSRENREKILTQIRTLL